MAAAERRSSRPGTLRRPEAPLLLLPLLACTSPDLPNTDTDSGPVDADSVVEGLTVELGAVETVLRVRWTTAEPTRGVVTGSLADGGIVEVAEDADTTEHEVLLAGFPARADVTVRVNVGGDDAEAVITTGSLPTWLPDMTYTADVPEAAEGGFTVTSIIDTIGGGLVVYDGAGRPVWAHQRDEEKPPSIIRARRALDGTAMLYNTMAHAVDEPGLLVRVALDGTSTTDIAVTGAHTDFVELPSGGYATLVWDLRMFGGRHIVGDAIVEVADDGTTQVVWSAFDDFTPDLSRSYDHFIPGTPEAEDWTHINGLAYDAEADAYYVTMTWNDGVARIDRATGALAWWLSDDGGDFTREGEGPLVLQPHSAQPTPDGLLIFNRGDPSDSNTCSGATDVGLDEANGTARVTRSYTSERCLLVTYLGSAERLPGGNTLVSWSTAGQLDEVTPEGDVAWRLSAAIGAGFGFAERVPALGR